MSNPTRRFHLPSAVRPSPARIEPGHARELTAGGAVLIDVRRREDPGESPAGALRISPDAVPQHVDALREAPAVVLACT